jgi:hypothetical protein
VPIGRFETVVKAAVFMEAQMIKSVIDISDIQHIAQ